MMTLACYNPRCYDPRCANCAGPILPAKPPTLQRAAFRKSWDSRLSAYLKRLQEQKPVIACGDFSVARQEHEVHNSRDLIQQARFTPWERASFERVRDSTPILSTSVPVLMNALGAALQPLHSCQHTHLLLLQCCCKK